MISKLRFFRLFFTAVVFTVAASLQASVGQVTTLSTTAKTIIKPGPYDKTIVIQNNGSNSVRLSIDGGASYTDPASGLAGTNPTATTGILLPAGQQYIVPTAPTTNSNGSVYRPPIVAIMVSGSTTLDIATDGTQTVFPTP
jgi:hypothetical protein